MQNDVQTAQQVVMNIAGLSAEYDTESMIVAAWSVLDRSGTPPTKEMIEAMRCGVDRARTLMAEGGKVDVEDLERFEI
jgi:aerobic-type carbon monoxide dehydrogenase small subunit (CoxS/CutS family)